MHAMLFISPNLKTRQEKIDDFLKDLNLSKTHPDVIYLEDDLKLGVQEVKRIQSFLFTKPIKSDKKAIVIESSDKLTLAAQNSLLKIIEEPPLYTKIFFGASSKQTLLETLLSRFQVIQEREQTKDIEIDEQTIKDLEQMGLPERFTFIEKLDDKERFFYQLLHYYRKKMLGDKKNSHFVKILLHCEQKLKGNVNPRTILEYLMLELPLSP